MRDFSPLRFENGALKLLDQLALPNREVWIQCNSAAEVAAAITHMNIRGAPAIGIAAAYGAALAARAALALSQPQFFTALDRALILLAATRPTAVNLFWALSQVRAKIQAGMRESITNRALSEALLTLAKAIHQNDIASCKRIGANGMHFLPDGGTVLTHCNTGALATGGYGTALGVIRAASASGKNLKVIADETRPYLQGSRLTAWELAREGFDVTVIPDSAAAFLLARGDISCAIVGADRIANNGDTANKIGTYGVALAAHAAGVPFYVAAPTSTIDLETLTGSDIPIEMRSGTEVVQIGNHRVAPEGVNAQYPAFDITPATLITAIITDEGVASPPFATNLKAHCDATKRRQTSLPKPAPAKPI